MSDDIELSVTETVSPSSGPRKPSTGSSPLRGFLHETLVWAELSRRSSHQVLSRLARRSPRTPVDGSS